MSRRKKTGAVTMKIKLQTQVPILETFKHSSGYENCIDIARDGETTLESGSWSWATFRKFLPILLPGCYSRRFYSVVERNTFVTFTLFSVCSVTPTFTWVLQLTVHVIHHAHRPWLSHYHSFVQHTSHLRIPPTTHSDSLPPVRRWKYSQTWTVTVPLANSLETRGDAFGILYFACCRFCSRAYLNNLKQSLRVTVSYRKFRIAGHHC